MEYWSKIISVITDIFNFTAIEKFFNVFLEHKEKVNQYKLFKKQNKLHLEIIYDLYKNQYKEKYYLILFNYNNLLKID